MNGQEIGKLSGAAVAVVAAGTSWVEQAEAIIRVAGSFVALVSGCVVIYFTVLDRLDKRKAKKNETETPS